MKLKEKKITHNIFLQSLNDVIYIFIHCHEHDNLYNDVVDS